MLKYLGVKDNIWNLLVKSSVDVATSVFVCDAHMCTQEHICTEKQEAEIMQNVNSW